MTTPKTPVRVTETSATDASVTPDGKLHLFDRPPMEGKPPTYEQITPWSETGGVEYRIAHSMNGPTFFVVTHGPTGYSAWDATRGKGATVATREEADALLRQWYPPAETPCPRCDDEAEVARDVMDVLRNPPPPSPAMVENIRAASAIRRVDGSVTRAEFSEVAADVAFLTSGLLEDKQHLNRALDVVIRLQDQVAALVEHVATLEERTRPLGPVAPPIGDHVEALKERRRIVALLRSGSTGGTDDENAQCTAAWARAADLIEAGDK